MPSYEFKCPNCKIEVEQFFSVYTNATIWCQPCQVPMEKIYGVPGIIFKGDGWAGKK